MRGMASTTPLIMAPTSPPSSSWMTGNVPFRNVRQLNTASLALDRYDVDADVRS